MNLYKCAIMSGFCKSGHICNCEANDVGVVHNKQMNCLCIYRCLLTDYLHGKAAELLYAWLTAEITGQ